MILSRRNAISLLWVCAVIIAGLAIALCWRRDNCALIAKLHARSLPDKAKANVTRSFVDAAVEQAEASHGNDRKLFKRLTEERSQDGGYLIAYQQSGANKGTLLLHGVPTKTFCDADHPLCDDSQKSEVGKNLYNFETVNGVKEVQFWIDLANSGGGWAATYWKDDSGFMRPKYYYIKPVEGKDYFIASGYFA